MNNGYPNRLIIFGYPISDIRQFKKMLDIRIFESTNSDIRICIGYPNFRIGYLIRILTSNRISLKSNRISDRIIG